MPVLGLGTNAQKGFTLIEMSIVLVIIGLIIGGILKGQEVIESSRQKNLLVSIDSLRSATNTFYDRYQALPGDFKFATSRINTDTTHYTVGDGDGIVGTSVATTTGTSIASASNGTDVENVQFFVHLFGARLIGGVTPSTSVPTTGPKFGEGSPLPAAAFPASGFSVVYANYGDVSADSKVGHWLRVSRVPGAAGGVLSGKTMYALDAKSDDGVPGTGIYRSDGAGTGCGAGLTAYDGTNESLNCTAVVVIGN